MEKTDCEGIELLLEDCRGITNLEHIPENIESLALHKMTIEDLSGLHKKIPKIKVISFWDKTVVKHSILSLLKFDDLYISYHNIDPSFAKALEIVQKHQANKSIPDCMDELIEAGLKEYAKL
jgi:hypothetical protein